jgi:glycosyltransferase involved in cell wall biosynthesis
MPSDIICLSTHYWHDFWFRKQHFMSRLAAQGHRVLYVQPSFSMARPSEHPHLAHNRWFRGLVEQVDEKIYLFSPPRLLPKPGAILSSRLNYRWFATLINREAGKLRFGKALLWVYRPEYAEALNLIPHSRLVFDLADDLAAYNQESSRYEYIAGCVEKLAAQADLMVVTSPTLLEKYRAKTRHCLLVPNGFDETLFDGAPKPIPEDLRPISHPIIGFIGVLFGFLDYELLYETASTMPQASFVFVGPTEPSGSEGVKRLQALDNTYFLGRKTKEQIPGYVTNFDLCINPFKVDDVSRAVSPLKVYEFLACGKPVVSTPMEGLSQEEAGSWVQFADKDRFVSALRESLANLPPSGRNAACIQAAQAFSWSSQFAKLQSQLSYFSIL